MALQVTPINRKFQFKKNGQVITLEDPDPSLTPEEVCAHYGSQYPELTTAEIEPAKVVGDSHIFSIKTTVGTKG